MTYLNVGDRINQIRKENKMTQAAFANEVGISQTHVSKIEKGIENPSETLIKFICYKYCVNEEWLKTGIGSNHHLINDFTDTFQRARYKYEVGLRNLNESDELVESTFAFEWVCEILDCQKIGTYSPKCLEYLENVNRLFSAIHALFESGKVMAENDNFQMEKLQANYDRLFPQIEEKIKKTLYDLGKNSRL